MKATALISLFAVSMALSTHAQDQAKTQAVEKAVNTQTIQKATVETQSQNPEATPSLTSPPKLPKKVKPAHRGEVRGLAVDLASTNRPVRVFDLRTPVDPVKDNSNLNTNPITGRAAGFRFLSIRF